jgi:hypothetical protein
VVYQPAVVLQPRTSCRASEPAENKDRARGRESGEDAQRCVSQDADTHADHCSDNHRPGEAGDR